MIYAPPLVGWKSKVARKVTWSHTTAASLHVFDLDRRISNASVTRSHAPICLTDYPSETRSYAPICLTDYPSVTRSHAPICLTDYPSETRSYAPICLTDYPSVTRSHASICLTDYPFPFTLLFIQHCCIIGRRVASVCFLLRHFNRSNRVEMKLKNLYSACQ